MGNQNSINEQSIEFHSFVNDPNLGVNEIFTARFFPMCYIIKIKRRDEHIYATFAKIENQQNKCLLSLYAFKKTKHCDCNQLSGEGIIAYWEYFNFYLKQLIERRAQKWHYFAQEEVWHLVKVCCEGYMSFRAQNLFYEFQSTKILVTPQGKLKIFWAHLQAKNLHLNYFKYFASTSYHYTRGYYSPEQLIDMGNKERTLANQQKSNVFSFAMLLFYVMSLSDPLTNFYMGYELDLKNMFKFIENRLQKVYSKQLILLLHRCMQPNPLQRPYFSKILQDFQQNLSNSFSIKLTQQQSSQMLKTDRKYTDKISLRRRQ